ncbi:hypothetical protein PLICRDRAFT_89138 [Plicaturopsis crispa FD-325 SS-3]|nr:hypothetical protein PLICRDRAFT_89138 [Plicaturopsis crispa FD-325 SS-3]
MTRPKSTQIPTLVCFLVLLHLSDEVPASQPSLLYIPRFARSTRSRTTRPGSSRVLKEIYSAPQASTAEITRKNNLVLAFNYAGTVRGKRIRRPHKA